MIDFGHAELEEASLYEAPFEYVKDERKPLRDNNRDRQRREYWWLHGEPAPDMRAALADMSRHILHTHGSPSTAFSCGYHRRRRYRIAVVVFARDDDYTSGCFTRGLHEVWARKNRYAASRG